MNEKQLMKSASSGQSVPIWHKVGEAHAQFQMLWQQRAPWRDRDFSHLDKQFSEYDEIAIRFGGFCLRDARVFEIGCGQRPHRLFYMVASGVDAEGIDLDKVFMSLRIGNISESYERNGFERTLKTILRHTLFDRMEHRRLHQFLSRRAGGSFSWPLSRIIHGNTADPEAWPDDKFDFVLSEDVFEHITPEELPVVCGLISDRLTDRGIAFIRPMVFTGLQGGHNVEWYDATEGKQRKCPPWDHLRENRYPANTYLNKLHLKDYRSLFSEYFDVVEEQVQTPGLGRCFMTPELRCELSEFADDELYSNHVRFVLKRRAQ